MWIEQLIRQELNPQQVVNYLKRHKKMSLHHETFYLLIYIDKANGGDLYQHLRMASKPYRKRYGSYNRRGKIKNRVDIDDRPEIVDCRSRIGDREGDTVMGKRRKNTLLTIVERKTLYTMIVRLTERRADLLADAAVENIREIKSKKETITFDNGLEFSEYEVIADKLAADIYFAQPDSSWEQDINEKTNRLIRQYFPQGTDFNEVTDAQLEAGMERLNNRPIRTRGSTPNELLMGQRLDLPAA